MVGFVYMSGAEKNACFCATSKSRWKSAPYPSTIRSALNLVIASTASFFIPDALKKSLSLVVLYGEHCCRPVVPAKKFLESEFVAAMSWQLGHETLGVSAADAL